MAIVLFHCYVTVSIVMSISRLMISMISRLISIIVPGIVILMISRLIGILIWRLTDIMIYKLITYSFYFLGFDTIHVSVSKYISSFCGCRFVPYDLIIFN